MNQAAFQNFLPTRPYSGDVLDCSLTRREKEDALTFRYIQNSHPSFKPVLTFDLDRGDAWFAAEDAGLPDPNYICCNPNNGHAHAVYLLDEPVFFGGRSTKPQVFYKAVQRGYTRRLGGDWGYSGFLTKNPYSRRWETDWKRSVPYRLAELDDVLTAEDKVWRDKEVEVGHGRNCTLFDTIRQKAYREVGKVRKRGGSRAELAAFVLALAVQVNLEFAEPLLISEVRCTAESVSDWTWENVIPEGLSTRGRNVALKRWLTTNGKEIGKPWLREGVSRATWYRRKQNI